MFDAILSRFEKPLNMVISIDEETQSIHFMSMDEEDKTNIKHDIESYKTGLFTDEFYLKFDEILKAYNEKNPVEQPPRVAVVIPDKVIVFDAINVPVIKKQAMANSITSAINSLYKNSDDLKFNNVLLGQNKQYATFSVVGLRKKILEKIKSICEENQFNVAAVTFDTSSIVNGACNLNPDLRTESGLVLDVRANLTRIAYVVKGKVCGYYPLPFGFSTLYKSRLAAEDLLFDHSTGELLVLNAKERAKSRHLTTIEKTLILEENNDSNTDEGITETFTFDKKSGTKKVARKLPKSMMREAPKTREEFVYENFRIFMKWAQDLLIYNPVLTDLGSTKNIYVNMPKEFDYLFEMANNEVKDNSIEYKPLIADDVYDEEVATKLEIYGGFYCKQFNKTNCF